MIFSSHIYTELPGDQGVPGKQRRLAYIAVMIGTVMAVLDTTILNVALPAMARGLAVDAATIVWVVNAYLVTCAIALLPFASLGDKVGHHRIFKWGLILFTVASAACAVSPSVAWLIAMRALQGLGCAALACSATALTRNIFPARLLGAVMGINALIVASATTVGPSIGGMIISVLPWPWLFVVNIPCGAVALYLVHRFLPSTASTNQAFDYLGAALSALAIGVFMFAVEGLTKASSIGVALLQLLMSAALAMAFVMHLRRAPDPLLPLDIFRSKRFSMAVMTSVCCFVAQGIAFIALPFLFQHSLGVTPFESALFFTPWPLAIAIAAPLVGRLADHVNPAGLATLGAFIFAAGLAALAMLSSHPDAFDVCWRTALCGIGFGIFQAPNNREMLSNVPSYRVGSAAGVLNSARTLGQALGTALVAITLAITGARIANAEHYMLWLAGCSALLAGIVSSTRVRQSRANLQTGHDKTGNDMDDASF